MRRREFITLLGGAAATWPVAAHAQQSDHVRRIAAIIGADVNAKTMHDAFRQDCGDQAGLKAATFALTHVLARNIQRERSKRGSKILKNRDAADLPLQRFDAFIPSLQAIIFVNDLITSVFLFAQYSIINSRAMLALASAYLFTALMVVSHALTFPGTFAPTGLLGGGSQSTAWLYLFWHLGPPIGVLA